MSKNIDQIFVANPITSNASTDLMYFGQSPYGAGNDAAMTFANFSAQFGSPVTPAALTRTNDTNVTVTLGGSPSSALLQATSLTLGWAGQLALTRGGTNASLTASNGGVVYSTASALAILAGTATANLPLLSGVTAAPAWGAFALSLGGALTTAGAVTTVGAFGVTFTFTNTTAVTFPTSGTLATTSQIPTGAALTETNDTNVTLTLGGSPTTALVNAASITVGWTGTLSGTRGGTGVNNGASTITLGGSLVTSGAFASTFTMTNTTSVTFPTSGTLATTTQLPTPAALTSGNDTNVTLTLGGTPSTALLQAASVTAGWTGTLAGSRGGLGAAITASNGGIYYSTASNGALLSGTATANQVLLSGSTAAPAWSTATYPATTTVSQLLYSSSANTVAGLVTTNRAALSTNSTGVPTWLALTDGQLVVGSSAGSPAAATLAAGTGISITNASNSITIANTGGTAFVWNDVSGTTQTAAGNNGYIISNASQTTVTIPATIAEGQVIGIAGKGAAGWILQANTGQTIHYGSSATSSAGSLTSTNLWDSVQIVCVTANTTFSVITSQGNLTPA